MRLEAVPCDLCGADDASPVMWLQDRMLATTTERFRLVRCGQCGLLYLNPRPAAEALLCFYPDSYAPFDRRGLAARVKAWHTRRQVADLWSLLRPPARVLDVGCATGDLLAAIRRRGNANVVGVEPSAHAAALARERHGLNVITGELGDADLPAGSIDVVLMSHVIEHLPSPSRALSEVHRILRPGGALVLWLPSARSWAARIWGDAWIGYDPPRHLYTFAPDTLAQLLERHGFALREVSHEWIGLEWSWGLRLRARARLRSPAVDQVLARLHPALTAASTPLAAAAAVAGRAGRIRAIATAADQWRQG